MTNSPKPDFESLWQQVQQSDTAAIGEIIQRFEPLIKKLSKVNGKYDEDVAQDIRETLLVAVKKSITRNAKQPPTQP